MDLTEVYDLIAEVLISEIQSQLVKDGHLKRKGGLVDSFSHRITQGRLEILAKDYYGYYVEGRRPYSKKVPISALLNWIKRYRFKIGRGRNKKGKFISDISLAFAIQNAIYKRGIKKKIDVVDYVLKKNDNLISDLINDEFIKSVEEELDKIFND